MNKQSQKILELTNAIQDSIALIEMKYKLTKLEKVYVLSKIIAYEIESGRVASISGGD